ncbi:unnamed protein product [Protopolystoma xenopodis]|uniref:Uncharacterized protein n=1 Tax=Protopolystoma xenopodis TaxID=117903 RepID=A0A3S5AY95_9PLAT|nr:unnamed protein product [Protopolystoma xenopodis]
MAKLIDDTDYDACERFKNSSPAVRYPINPHAALTVVPLTHARQDDMRSKSKPVKLVYNRINRSTLTTSRPSHPDDLAIYLSDDTLPQSSNNELPRPTTAKSPEAWLSEVAVSLTASPSAL